MEKNVITVRAENPSSETATKFIGALAADLAQRYSGQGGDGLGPVSPNEAFLPRSAFLVARLNGHPVGCGALGQIDHRSSEIKRLFVAPTARRRGVGRRILDELERLAGDFGYESIRLEAGPRQPEAIALFENCGYQQIPPPDSRTGNPSIVCFGKTIASNEMAI
jgi:GNAT superfamily N-acetyltransferase